MRIKMKCCGFLAWCVVCGVHAAASVRMHVGKPPPSCSVVRPLVVAPPAVRICICPRAAHCASSCCAHVCLRPQGRCGRCPPGSAVISDLSFLFYVAVCRTSEDAAAVSSVIMLPALSQCHHTHAASGNEHITPTGAPLYQTLQPFFQRRRTPRPVLRAGRCSHRLQRLAATRKHRRCPLMHMRPQTGGSVVGLGIPCAAMVLADV